MKFGFDPAENALGPVSSCVRVECEERLRLAGVLPFVELPLADKLCGQRLCKAARGTGRAAKAACLRFSTTVATRWCKATRGTGRAAEAARHLGTTYGTETSTYLYISLHHFQSNTIWARNSPVQNRRASGHLSTKPTTAGRAGALGEN